MSAIYKIIGKDGKEYGPVTGEQIRQWIAEGRVERRTPVFVDGAKDWNFVGLLPEFAGLFRRVRHAADHCAAAARNFHRRADGENQFLCAGRNDFRDFIGDVLLLRISVRHPRPGFFAHRAVADQRQPGTARGPRHGHRRIDPFDFEPAAGRGLDVF